jgi:2OG-Fe(II) oxygenase superfamily/Phosphotransferase enzyme family
MPYDSHHIDKQGQTWSIRGLLASDRPRVLRRLKTAALWSRTSHRRSWGAELPSPAYILAASGLRRGAVVADDAVIQYEDTAADHGLRIASLIRAHKRGDVFDPLIIGLDGLLWDGKHRLAALYACEVPEVEVLDFSGGSSELLRPPVVPSDVLAPRLLAAHASGMLRDRFDRGQPYRHVFIPEVFEAGFADALLRDIEGLPWRLAATDFYEQYEDSLIDTERFYAGSPLDALREVAMSPEFAEFIGSVTSQGQLEVVDMACHRSTAGQQIGIHNDFYPEGEVCRFTIHLNPGWTLEDGGLFVTFTAPDSSAVRAAYLPAMNSALLFEISPASFHAVTEVSTARPRYSIVISFVRRRAAEPPDKEVARLADARRKALSRLRPEVVDVRSLSRLRTRRCAPGSCGGACCKDGAGLLPEEAHLLDRIARTHTEELSALGVTGAGIRESGLSPRTSLETDATGQTHCGWMTPAGRCSLQVLGENHVQQPWIYKPLACVLVPLRVRSLAGARVLTADRRTLDRSHVAAPCLRRDDAAAALEGVEDEIAFIGKMWDLDVHAILEAANQNQLGGRDGEDVVGIVAATKKHVLWAIGDSDRGIDVLKVPRTSSAGDSQEKTVLQRLTGRWFPVPSENSVEPQGVARMSLIGGHIPLDLWLSTRRLEVEVIDVAWDILRALVALEDSGVYHLDLAPRNVLVHPDARTVVIIDFEDAVDGAGAVECAGGEFGYAAPEQYLNYLGFHSRLTESFFVGAFIYHAFAQLSRRRQCAFPFSDLGCVPLSLRGLVTALTGDPSQFYAPGTRRGAREIFDRLMAGLPFEPAPIRPPVKPAIEQEQRRLDNPDGSTLLIRRRGLTLLHGETTIDQWNGLVDVANTPAAWTDTLRIGPLIITSDGFMRSPRTD